MKKTKPRKIILNEEDVKLLRWLKQNGSGGKNGVASSYYTPPYNPYQSIHHDPEIWKGRATARRQLLDVLSPRQKFCLKFLGRYTLRGASGTIFKIEINNKSAHQWFYCYDPKINRRYYFSLVVNGKDIKTSSTAERIYVELLSMHMSLKMDDVKALRTSNWEYGEDKKKWERRNYRMPPKLTFDPKKRKPEKPLLGNIWGIADFLEDARDWFPYFE